MTDSAFRCIKENSSEIRNRIRVSGPEWSCLNVVFTLPAAVILNSVSEPF